jgi:hypothetical protein
LLAQIGERKTLLYEEKYFLPSRGEERATEPARGKYFIFIVDAT